MRALLHPLTGAVITFLVVQWGVAHLIKPPPPGMIKLFYGAVTLVAILVFTASDDKRLKTAWAPIEAVFLARCAMTKTLRALFFIAIPLWVGTSVYQSNKPKYAPPAEPRTVHPEPPASLTVKGNQYKLKEVANPLHGEEEKFTEEGHRVYYQNCFFCHGDNHQGEGMFAYGLNPIPANFRDSTTIAMLEEGYVFWRVGLGYAGLPAAGTPWNSAMPVWQEMLTEEEIWSAILYIYAATGQQPRTWGEAH